MEPVLAAEGIHSPALMSETLNVHISNCQTLGELLRLSQNGAVLSDDVVSGKDHILGRFADTSITVSVAAGQRAGLRLDDRSPVVGLADDLVTA